MNLIGNFDDTPYQYNERSAGKQQAKPFSKLQNLLDRASEIEKVPEALIEQENKLRERQAFGLDSGMAIESRKRVSEGNLINSLKTSAYQIGMGNQQNKRAVFEDRSNFYIDASTGKPRASVQIDKNEFIRNAVNSIQLPPSHTFLGEHSNPKQSAGYGYTRM